MISSGAANDDATDERWEFTNLHAIDMRREDDTEIARELIGQMETIGFLVLTQVPGYEEEVYLDACKALHELPASVKHDMFLQKDEPTHSNVYRGYQPFKPNDASHKEFFDQGFPVGPMDAQEAALPLYEDTPFPDAQELQWIKESFCKTQQAWFAAALRVLRLLALGLGKPAAFFDPWFEGATLTTLRTIHYAPRASGLVDSSQLGPEDLRLTTPEHADSGILTLLATFGYPGLQVYIDGEYRSVAPIRDTLVVNLGDLFARLTNYRLKATFHRVLDIGTERFSSPMFLEPKYSAAIPRGLMDSNRTSVDQDLPHDAPLFGDWLMRRMMASYAEWQGFVVPGGRKPFVEAIELADFANSIPGHDTSW
ncbi:1-aminocyclopropane-1-carboxylate oxidase 2 [Hondaea fermentalgiana]|uniref:1-aminocyclopropane-1-carboxylate oxidase 2 n=1 Tax=Hondaea fermentalgiana TaxID=2315210 RepID=A0A2R5GEM1_9STRA|nr:1-aminocyclopropane-1-carboxylate oxidase 2 [Hondaea fermentalgiana]|eukprot:GBG29387.1 1-aminocyclopropane-1-carboxylate oxidase 2 [Hondaea fermentalgiana]